MRILVILSGDADSQPYVLPDFHGLIEAYYLFRDAGAEVVVAAPGGGSVSEPLQTDCDGSEEAEAVVRFKADREARDVMNDLLDLDSVCAEDFDGALCIGNADALVAQLLAASKPMAVVVSSAASQPSAPTNGILIIGSGKKASRLAAKALLGAIELSAACRPSS